AYKPHELTQQFVTGDVAQPRPYTHRAPWFDEDLLKSSSPQSHRLYRVLEFLGTHNQTIGMMTAVTHALQPIPEGSNIAVSMPALFSRSATGGSWRIAVGSSLIIDRGLDTEEVVRVKAVVPATSALPPQLVADFLKPHAAK